MALPKGNINFFILGVVGIPYTILGGPYEFLGVPHEFLRYPKKLVFSFISLCPTLREPCKNIFDEVPIFAGLFRVSYPLVKAFLRVPILFAKAISREDDRGHLGIR